MILLLNANGITPASYKTVLTVPAGRDMPECVCRNQCQSMALCFSRLRATSRTRYIRIKCFTASITNHMPFQCNVQCVTKPRNCMWQDIEKATKKSFTNSAFYQCLDTGH